MPETLSLTVPMLPADVARNVSRPRQYVTVCRSTGGVGRARCPSARRGSVPPAWSGGTELPLPERWPSPFSQSGNTIFSGFTCLSKSSGLTSPSSAAACRRVMLFLCASLATLAALS